METVLDSQKVIARLSAADRGRYGICGVCEVYNAEVCDQRNPRYPRTIEHSKRVESLEQLGKYSEKLAYLLSNRTLDDIRKLERIRWQDWKNHVHAAMFECLTLLPDTTGKGALKRVIKIMTWYEQRELLIPLQLAIWKSQCLVDLPPVLGCYIFWATTGWKANKGKQWDSNARAIIVSLVEPFLFKV
jgi:hypothetical protein